MVENSSKKSPKQSFKNLELEELKAAYELMCTARSLDEKMMILIRQGKSFFHIGAMGHEAVQIAAASVLKKGKDILFPYYRDQAFVLAMGMTPLECMLGFLAREGDPSSGARQMPQHFGHKACNIPTSSSSTGTQYLQAVGCALASQRKQNKDLPVTVVCSGEGTTSQGDFHEALNWASRAKAPVIFLVENNGYAISVPVSEQRTEARVSEQAKGYQGLFADSFDGCDYLASKNAFETAVARARKGEGPTLLDASVVRLLPHSSSDDQKKYRPSEELSFEKTRDPLPALRALCLKQKGVKAEDLDAIARLAKQTVEDAADAALKAPFPDPKKAQDHVWSSQPEPRLVSPENLEEKETVLVDAVNKALAEELKRDENIVMFGQDIAGNKGGVFTATRNLTKQFGKDRVFNAPLAEASIVGVAIGMALQGLKPVVEIQFADYIWTAMMQIRNELATIRYRSNNDFKVPMVIRVPVGGYIHGGLCHSQNIEGTFAHIPGLKICMPSTALDAYGLLKSAIRSDDPVLFLEHKALYRQAFAKSQLPKGDDFLIPFGKGRVVKEGTDLTVVTYGAMVQRSLEAARVLERERGLSVEILDLRSINPLDFELIEQSVKKTSKALVVYEDCKFMGYGAELAAQISEKLYEHLDGPVLRVAAKDAPIPYSPLLENEILPQSADIEDAILKLSKY